MFAEAMIGYSVLGPAVFALILGVGMLAVGLIELDPDPAKAKKQLEDLEKQMADSKKAAEDAEQKRKDAEKNLAEAKKAEEAARRKQEEEEARAAGDQKKLDELADRDRAAAKKAVEDANAEAARIRESAENDAKKGKILLALTREGIKSGLKNDRYLSLVDEADVTINDKGEVVGADKAVEKLKKDSPELFGATSPSGPDRTPPGPGGDKSFVDKMLEATNKTRKPKMPQGFKRD